MITAEINYWAVLVSAVVAVVINYVWYSPIAFGRVWANLTGRIVDKSLSVSSSNRAATIKMFFLGLLMVYILAHFVDYTSATTVGQGALTGLWLWLGFVATTSLGTFLSEDRPLKLWAINAGYQLITLVITGAILATWA